MRQPLQFYGRAGVYFQIQDECVVNEGGRESGCIIRGGSRNVRRCEGEGAANLVGDSERKTSDVLGSCQLFAFCLGGACVWISSVVRSLI